MCIVQSALQQEEEEQEQELLYLMADVLIGVADWQ